MKIDMSRATLEWLEAWKAKKLAGRGGSFFNRVELTQVEAYRQFIQDKLEIYLPEFQVSECEVTLYMSSAYRADLKTFMRAEFILKGGIAVINEISAESYYEAYCEDPSVRLEINFCVQK